MKKRQVLVLFLIVSFVFMTLFVSAFSLVDFWNKLIGKTDKITGQAIYDALPADRVINWDRDNVGVPGGIPNRTTNCVTSACNTLYSGTVTAASIQSAINSALPNTVVRIPAGNYTLLDSFTVASNITLRGAGMGKTNLRFTSGGTGIYSTQMGFQSTRSITSDYTKGSNQIQVSSVSGVQPGFLMIISQDREPGLVYGNGPWNDPDRPFMQIVRVESVSGQTITFSPSLHYSFSASLNPVYKISYALPTQFCGIEDMTIDTQIDGFAAVWFDNSYACWFSRVESRYASNFHFFFSSSLRGEVRQSYFYETNSENDGFGVGLYWATTNFLVEDNIIESMWTAVIGYGTSGSVIAYNYVYDAHTNVWPHQTPAFNTNHGAHGFMNLWEGNVGAQIQNDGYHGSCSHQTIFRNKFNGLSPQFTTNRKMIDLTRWSYYHNVLGNLLGDPSWNPSAYEMTGEPDYSYSVIYRLGYPNMGNNAYTSFDGRTDFDPKVKETLLRHGNYDYFNKAIVWDSSISNHNLPASLYYSSKPSWWGNSQWPAFGPDPNTPTTLLNGKIPAQIRFEGNGEPPADITPPVRSSGSPSGNLSAGTTSTTISLNTNEVATCRYSTTAEISYSSMANNFSTTGSTTHSQLIIGLTDGNTYNYYVKCIDNYGNADPDDYLINFYVSYSTTEIVTLQEMLSAYQQYKRNEVGILYFLDKLKNWIVFW